MTLCRTHHRGLHTAPLFLGLLILHVDTSSRYRIQAVGIWVPLTALPTSTLLPRPEPPIIFYSCVPSHALQLFLKNLKAIEWKFRIFHWDPSIINVLPHFLSLYIRTYAFCPRRTLNDWARVCVCWTLGVWYVSFKISTLQMSQHFTSNV